MLSHQQFHTGMSLCIYCHLHWCVLLCGLYTDMYLCTHLCTLVYSCVLFMSCHVYCFPFVFFGVLHFVLTYYTCLTDIMHSKQLPSQGEWPTHPLHQMMGANCTTYIIWASSGHEPSCLCRGMMSIAVVEYFMAHKQQIPVCVPICCCAHLYVVVTVYCY